MAVRLLLPAVLILAGCAARRPLPVAPPSREYFDLRPGQTLRVITPLLRSGGFAVPGASAAVGQGEGRLQVTVDTKGDFLGYEEALYAISDGLRITPTETATILDGVRTPAAKPRVPLFELPRRSRYVRLLYLLRSSAADHNMAVLAAPDLAGLERLTAAVRANPAADCRAPRCVWVPAGIAVRPLNP
jgi:hypothetical protein